MYFNGDEAFHGVYWHNNFGTPQSHGCVGMPNYRAKQIYDWSPTASTSGSTTDARDAFRLAAHAATRTARVSPRAVSRIACGSERVDDRVERPGGRITAATLATSGW
jgi:hypothetical protein